MPPPFKQISLQEFAGLLLGFPWGRTITSVHMHHTWRPNHSMYAGHASIEGMWRYHTEEKKWSDIAQHLSIGPAGELWLGRNWNSPPASASGHNGNSAAGPFMFEMIGDFDTGRDPFGGAQRDAALRVVALVQRRHGLVPETLTFHNALTTAKSCPGTAIDYKTVLEAVRGLHGSLGEEEASEARGTEKAPRLFGEETTQDYARMLGMIEVLKRPGRGMGEESGDAELDEKDQPGAGVGGSSREGDPDLTPQVLAGLRAHVINLRQGGFSSDGLFRTTPEDVDAIFTEHLPREAKAAAARGEKLRVVFFAHGGLVSESNALRTARSHVDWWMRNNVYPVYFVWETGFMETVRQLLSDSRGRGARDLWDFTTDRVIEAGVRALYGPRIWLGMKESAARASQPEGGARYAARRLRAFCELHEGQVELHAIGHSAGSIFHTHFLHAANEEKCLAFASAHFLAPAVRADLFTERLLPLIGNGVAHLTVYTMKKDREEGDHCAGAYRKSLLYLIYHGFEDDRATPLLGLEICLRADASLRKLFGLGGAVSSIGEVLWSDTAKATGRSATTATTHGGFDEDAATMESVLRRILAIPDAASIVPFPAGATRNLDTWEGEVDWPEELAPRLRPGPLSGQPAAAWIAGAAPPAVPGFAPSQGHGDPPRPPLSPGGRRRALCVGIDRYPDNPLSACVADARLWASTLHARGFETQLLLDSQATRQGILESLLGLVRSGRAGDVLVFQFAGHGTRLLDLDGDEGGGAVPDPDEAICPYDSAQGAYLLDDDVAEVFAHIGHGVNVTCFIDCCHSGTISRFGAGAPPPPVGDRRPRFIAATPEMNEAHRRFRGAQAGRGRGAVGRGPVGMREVLFSACRTHELAWESDGQGEFTLRATRLLAQGGMGATHHGFQAQLLSAFGEAPRQHPELDCAPEALRRILLEPLTGSAGRGLHEDASGRGGTGDLDGVVHRLVEILRNS